MIWPTNDDIGRRVVYIGHAGERQTGTISSIRDMDRTFVRYSSGDTAALTRNDQLHWPHLLTASPLPKLERK